MDGIMISYVKWRMICKINVKKNCEKNFEILTICREVFIQIYGIGIGYERGIYIDYGYCNNNIYGIYDSDEPPRVEGVKYNGC